MDTFSKLVDIVEQREIVEDKYKKLKAEFDEKNSVLLAQLEDLKEKEVLLREEALLTLDKEGISSKDVEDKIVYSQVRVTKSVDDPRKLKTSIVEHSEELAGVGVVADIGELFALETVVVDKKGALEVAKKYYELTGQELDGVGVKTTKFLTIKTKQE